MVHTGSWGTPDFGITEKLGSLFKKPTTYQGGSNLVGAMPQASSGQVLGSQAAPYSPTPASSGSIPSSGGNYSGGSGSGFNPAAIPGDAQGDMRNELIEGQRNRAEDDGQARIKAAIGVFDAKKQGLLNRIPGLQQNLSKTLEGYDLGLQDFTNTSNMEEGKRVRDIDATIGQTNEDYTRAYRGTRQTAKSLARQLRNMFASRGSLDSTQYRDMAIDQSSDIAQTLGDTRREQAGKISTFEGEKGDIKDYYAQQRDAEAKRVRIAKEQEQIRTDQLVQGIMDDANLTDAQKIEAILEQQSALDQRLSDLDMREQELVAEQTKNAQDLELKKAELANKSYSSSFTTAKNTNTAIKNGQAILASYEDRFGSPPTPEQAYQVFIDNGVDDETAKRYASFLYTGGGGGNQEDPNSIAAGLGY